MAQVSGRGRQAQVVGAVFVLLVAASCVATRQGDDHAAVSSLVATPPDVSNSRPVTTRSVGQTVADLSFAKAPERMVVPGHVEKQVAPKKNVSKGKVIYLTFDDGPTVSYTKKVLNVLDEYDARATFFELGDEATAHPELTRLVVARGHALGSHTWNHRDLRRLSRTKVDHQLSRTSTALGKISGRPITCMRPPYGAVNARVKKAVRAEDLHLKLWDIDPRDWKRPGAAAIARRVVSHAHSGAVSLMHDGGGNRSQSVKALERILRKLSKRGYAFESLPGC